MKKDFKITTIPGLIDMHVHFREPGYTEKETIETGIKSAICGDTIIVSFSSKSDTV